MKQFPMLGLFKILSLKNGRKISQVKYRLNMVLFGPRVLSV